MVPTSIMPSWPSFRPKSTLPPKITSYPRDCRRVDYPLDFIIVLDAANFDRSQFSKILESLATLVDESFNLSPDVVRVGLIVYRLTCFFAFLFINVPVIKLLFRWPLAITMIRLNCYTK